MSKFQFFTKPVVRNRNLTLNSKSYGKKFFVQEAFKTGERLLGFSVEQNTFIPELELTATRLRHESTGAEHLHISRDDNNNVFGIGFSTPPKNNNGTPHILEHTTLCGSNKYPVHDPFFKMLNRSLANFMNALTASDYTLYPFSTTNKLDYENLRDVYMDSTFHPILRELNFKQEGWRLENQDPQENKYLEFKLFHLDSSTPLQFKGISDAGYLFCSKVQQYMFPNTIYGYNSGGDPKYITDITYDELKQFHKFHYHPSNVKFYTYGNFRLEDHLYAINNKISEFDKVTLDEGNKVVEPFNSPRRISFDGPLDPLNNPEKQAKMSISFLTNDIKDVFDTFALKIFSYLLLEGHASPMYKALIDSNIGSDFSENTGYDPSVRTSYFSIGLQGMRLQDVELAEKTIKDVLENVYKHGFDMKRVDAAIHQTELGKKHKTSDFGLNLMHGLSSGWFNNADPIEILQINKNLDKLKGKIKSEPFFQNLISKYFLNNPHTLICIMKPNPSFSESLNNEEQNRLQKIVSKLSNSDKDIIFKQNLDLIKNQEKKEDISVLPTLKISDIPKEINRFELMFNDINDVNVQWRKASTNGITYFRAISQLDGLPNELRLYLPLFAQSLTSLGTKSKSMAEIDDDIRLYTGGINMSTFLSTNHSDLNEYDDGLAIASHSLDRNINHMYDFIRYLIQETNFDNVAKLKSIIYSNATNMPNAVVESGHEFAKTYAASTLTPSLNLTEIYGGMTQVNFMNKLALLEDFQNVIEKLKELSLYFFSKNSLKISITCGEEAVNQNEHNLSKFLNGLPTNNRKSSLEKFEFQAKNEKALFQLPFAVNFSAKCFKGVPFTDSDGAKLSVLSALMRAHYLHREIREKNGAYGGGSTYNSQTGIFSFFSYRDPKAFETLNTYAESVNWLFERKFSKQELDEAKLSLFQRIDAPISVSQEGLVYFTDKITDDLRQKRREQLLSVTEDDVKEAAYKYLKQQDEMKSYSIAIIGGSGEETQKINEINK
ncbi:8890_t:CDS:10, partial [Entrophospora sp. SA101]